MRPRPVALSFVTALCACTATRDESPDVRTVAGGLPSTPVAEEMDSGVSEQVRRTLTLQLGGGVTMDLVLVPAGRFMMGSPESEEKGDTVGTLAESPPHEVVIGRSFYVGKHEVTNAQFRRFDPDYSSGKDNSIDYPDSRIEGIDLDHDDQPVSRVPWADAIAFCEWLSQRSGWSVRLPSEEEWEYACRAGTTTPFHYGVTMSTDLANYNGGFVYGPGREGEFRKTTTSVGTFLPNGFGLHDMHGNMWEWCADWRDPRDPSSDRIARGGSWLDKPGTCRSAIRFPIPPTFRRADVGFRVVVSERR